MRVRVGRVYLVWGVVVVEVGRESRGSIVLYTVMERFLREDFNVVFICKTC